MGPEPTFLAVGTIVLLQIVTKCYMWLLLYHLCHLFVYLIFLRCILDKLRSGIANITHIHLKLCCQSSLCIKEQWRGPIFFQTCKTEPENNQPTLSVNASRGRDCTKISSKVYLPPRYFVGTPFFSQVNVNFIVFCCSAKYDLLSRKMLHSE